MSDQTYAQLRAYWNEVFSQAPPYTVDGKLPYPELVEAIRWIGDQANDVLDFGCGTGKALFAALRYGVKRGVGIDLSDKAVALATGAVEKAGWEDKCSFKQGGLEELAAYEDGSFDGMILFNILDNLEPADGKRLVQETARLLKKNGALILKLNPVYEDCVFEDDADFEKVDENCWREESGLIFWNLNLDTLEDLLEPYFISVKGYDVDMKDFETVNRLYMLKRK